MRVRREAEQDENEDSEYPALDGKTNDHTIMILANPRNETPLYLIFLQQPPGDDETL